jgi:hypothetical protein
MILAAIDHRHLLGVIIAALAVACLLATRRVFRRLGLFTVCNSGVDHEQST